MKLLFIGVQASGKGTQAKKISKKLNIPHISSGEIFRSLDTTTKLGRKVKKVMEKGGLVSDELTNKLVFQRLRKEDCKNGFILDGYPRNLSQAKALDNIHKLDNVIRIKISKEEALKRISGRRVCPKCNKSYNVLTTPKPKEEGKCDVCGVELYQRKDETKESVEKRMKIYYEITQPILDFYNKKGIVLEIDGEQSIEKVQKSIENKLKI